MTISLIAVGVILPLAFDGIEQEKQELAGVIPALAPYIGRVITASLYAQLTAQFGKAALERARIRDPSKYIQQT